MVKRSLLSLGLFSVYIDAPTVSLNHVARNNVLLEVALNPGMICEVYRSAILIL